jgi:hypothetical protein
MPFGSRQAQPDLFSGFLALHPLSLAMEMSDLHFYILRGLLDSLDSRISKTSRVPLALTLSTLKSAANAMVEGTSALHTHNGGRSLTETRFVEYETLADLRQAVEKLDNREFKGQAVHCVSDVTPRSQPHSCCSQHHLEIIWLLLVFHIGSVHGMVD